jgi:hypothetical protein
VVLAAAPRSGRNRHLDLLIIGIATIEDDVASRTLRHALVAAIATIELAPDGGDSPWPLIVVRAELGRIGRGFGFVAPIADEPLLGTPGTEHAGV